MTTIDFLGAVWEQQKQLEPVTQAFFWMLFWLTLLITCTLVVACIIHVIDFVNWIVRAYRRQRQWMRERKHLQQINKIRTTSYKNSL